MKQLVIIIFSLTIISCGTDLKTDNDFKGGNYQLEIMDCETPMG